MMLKELLSYKENCTICDETMSLTIPNSAGIVCEMNEDHLYIGSEYRDCGTKFYFDGTYEHKRLAFLANLNPLIILKSCSKCTPLDFVMGDVIKSTYRNIKKTISAYTISLTAPDPDGKYTCHLKNEAINLNYNGYIYGVHTDWENDFSSIQHVSVPNSFQDVIDQFYPIECSAINSNKWKSVDEFKKNVQIFSMLK